MSVLDNLIFDRTQEDVANKTENGYYNYTDFNRVIESMQRLARSLNVYGYSISVQSNPIWNDADIPNAEDAKKYLDDLKNVRNALKFQEEVPTPCIVGISMVNGTDWVGNGGVQAVPDSLEYLRWDTANTIERILFRVNQGYKNMLASVVPCGTATSGGDYL